MERVMRESVKMHKISDVEVGSYLSSGVDSSYMAYLGEVDRTFTVGFGQEQYSEIKDAKEFADSIGVKNDSKIIEPEEYWDSLSDIQYYMDEPVADPAAIALYFLSKEAAKKVKVVLQEKDRTSCSEGIRFIVSRSSILDLIKSRVRSGKRSEYLQKIAFRAE